MSSTLADLLPTLATIAADRETRHSLAELARGAGQSSSSFQRAFSRLVGESPKQYTRRLQLESAALALLTSADSVLDVALAAGFESHEGFTRAFVGHFGVPPKDFRAQHGHLAADSRNADLIRHTGPCIGLFRASLDHQELPVNYDITRQPIAETTFLYGRGRCTHADIAKTLGPMLGSAFGFAMTNGLELRSPPTTLYVEWGPGMVTLHAGLGIAAAPTIELPEGLHVEVLPACEAAVTVHTGSYDGLADAHAAMDHFLHEHSLTRGGPAREVYLTDPGEVPDPAQWKTQIVWPLRA
jgi:AraC family transcriptional regulator